MQVADQILTRAVIMDRVPVIGKATFRESIPANTDYDTITTAGNYRCVSIANATSMTNCPSQKAHILTVIETADTPDRLIQIIIENLNVGTGIFYRIKDINGFSPWKIIGVYKYTTQLAANDGQTTIVLNAAKANSKMSLVNIFFDPIENVGPQDIYIDINDGTITFQAELLDTTTITMLLSYTTTL